MTRSPRTESERLAALARLQVLDTPPEPAFDGLVRAAALACDVPISQITLVDAERQWSKASIGLSGTTQMPRDISFCIHALGDDGVLEVPDMTADPRFARNPLVFGAEHARFYAGAVLRLADGSHVGTLCVIDRRPGRLTPEQREMLSCLARTVVQMLEARLTTQDLEHAHERLRVTLQSIGDAVITTDATGEVTWQNPVAERLTGWPSTDAVGMPLERIFHVVDEDTRSPVDDLVASCMDRGERAEAAEHAVLVSREGDERNVRHSAAPILDGTGTVLGAVLVFHDVTEQRRLSGEMAYRAEHDELTGLVNRSEFEKRLRRRLEGAREDRTENALFYIDLDQFKLVNDACGHAAGDRLLVEVARLLGETVRGSDTLARLGGDEFGVILEHCTGTQALRVAQEICDRMEVFRFMHDGRPFRIGTSIGLVPLDDRWVDASAVMQAADMSCYAAKEAGRNRAHVWFDTDETMQGRQGDMRWATRLAQALDEERFELHMQRLDPLAPDGGGGVCAEMLVRLREPDGRLILPNAFLPAAERFNLVTRIDRWVLRSTVERLASGPGRSNVALLCINLSGRSIGDRVFLQDAVDLLEGAGTEVCERLCLEITETAAVTNMNEAIGFIERVRALGVRVALDDFGAGASSFGYLRSLPVDLLKIDGQFIRSMIEDALSESAVRCFVDVARVMGLKTVAEFVDRPETLERVRELGVDYAQGFLLHRPEPVDGRSFTLAGAPGDP